MSALVVESLRARMAVASVWHPYHVQVPTVAGWEGGPGVAAGLPSTALVSATAATLEPNNGEGDDGRLAGTAGARFGMVPAWDRASCREERQSEIESAAAGPHHSAAAYEERIRRDWRRALDGAEGLMVSTGSPGDYRALGT